MKKWEYTIISVAFEGGVSVSEMNKLGAKGWRYKFRRLDELVLEREIPQLAESSIADDVLRASGLMPLNANEKTLVINRLKVEAIKEHRTRVGGSLTASRDAIHKYADLLAGVK